MKKLSSVIRRGGSKGDVGAGDHSYSNLDTGRASSSQDGARRPGGKPPALVTVTVPKGARPGQQLKVRLPGGGQSVVVTLCVPARRTPPIGSPPPPSCLPTDAGVRRPPNVQAGSLLQLSIETQRRIAVRLPPTVQPGQMLTARAPNGGPAPRRPCLASQLHLKPASQARR